MRQNQGTTPPHPTNQESHSNNEIAKETLKVINLQIEAINSLATYLLTICALTSIKDGLFSEMPTTYNYYHFTITAIITLISIYISIRKQYLQRRLENGIASNRKELFSERKSSCLRPGNFPAEAILSFRPLWILRKKKTLRAASLPRLTTLTTHYGIQITLLTSFIAVTLSETPYPTFKIAAAITLTIVPAFFTIIVCILTEQSNRRLANHILKSTKG